MDRTTDSSRNDLVSASVTARAQSITFVIPVYNEEENFPILWEQLTSRCTIPFAAMAVYDFDEDKTVPVVRRIIDSGEKRLSLVRNKSRGVVNAILTGFDRVSDGPIVVLMADLSDDLDAIPRMFALYNQGFDVVAGSRYMPGGAIIGGPWLKKNLSRGAGVSLKLLRGIPTCDATNAFKMYDAKMLKKFQVESKGGFEINLELTVKAFLAGYRIAETPSVWRDRESGESKFQMWKWLPSYLRWYFFAFQPKN